MRGNKYYATNFIDDDTAIVSALAHNKSGQAENAENAANELKNA